MQDYKEYENTIDKISQSDGEKKFIESNRKVYNFDKFTEDICKCYRNKRNLCSVDAFAISENNEFLFIEFKNVRKSHFPKSSLPPKAFDSIYTAQFFLKGKYSIEYLKEHSILIVVYNDDAIYESQKENSSEYFKKFEKIIGNMAQMDNSTGILFDLEKYKGILYKDIVTISKNEFIEKYMSKCNLLNQIPCKL